MSTSRGFVQRIEVGRGGLVTVLLVLESGATGTYVIHDLDADPERFNERLSKLAVLRDAMNRAEPVEVEHDKGEAGEEIQRAARIARDALAPTSSVDQVVGLVLDLLVHSENGVAAGGGERHDHAEVRLLSLTGGVETARLDLQAPERAVATQMLDMLRDALATGAAARLLVDRSDDSGTSRIVQVAVVDGASAFDDGSQATVVCGFVESLGLLPLSGGGQPASSLAWMRFTTTPELSGPGGTVDPAAFAPESLTLLVPVGSATYQLVEAGLRDNVRMRVAGVPLARRPERDPQRDERPVPRKRGAAVTHVEEVAAVEEESTAGDVPLLTLAAELQAPLASASRPVWLLIDRSMIDSGPDADCTPGLPVHDLTPRGLRDLRIPYTAQWRGLGCFNHGVYRIELALEGEVKVELDGQELCVYESATPGTKMAYACVGGDHWLTVEMAGWTCDRDFVMNVYRIR